MENYRQLISVVADGLLRYKPNLDKWTKDIDAVSALKKLNIVLKWVEIGERLITQVNYFNNIYKILLNIIT
jgi:hypothetical protein